MPKLILISLCLLVSITSYSADKGYQEKNLVGDWHSFFDVMPEQQGARITFDSATNEITVKYCDEWTLSMERKCQEDLNWQEIGPYVAVDDGFRATFGELPKYLFRVDPKDSDTMTKSWGAQSVEYKRIK